MQNTTLGHFFQMKLDKMFHRIQKESEEKTSMKNNADKNE